MIGLSDRVIIAYLAKYFAAKHVSEDVEELFLRREA